MVIGFLILSHRKDWPKTSSRGCSKKKAPVAPLSVPNGFPTLNKNLSGVILKPFTKEDIKKSLFDMAPYKFPSNDRFHAGLFQKAWEVFGDSLDKYSLNLLQNGVLPEGSNDTLLVLILKVK